MMHRRPIIHAFLSLMLLLSQHLAMTHVLSHGVDGGNVSLQKQQGNGDVSRKVASERFCHQCLGFSQIAYGVGSSHFTLAVVPPFFLAPAAPRTPANCLRTICVFRSRAPPQT